ncbi:MAG: hypothetical protein NVSMB62_05490 [Acidobacteriaceae bacterium]
MFVRWRVSIDTQICSKEPMKKSQVPKNFPDGGSEASSSELIFLTEAHSLTLTSSKLIEVVILDPRI